MEGNRCPPVCAFDCFFDGVGVAVNVVDILLPAIDGFRCTCSLCGTIDRLVMEGVGVLAALIDIPCADGTFQYAISLCGFLLLDDDGGVM